MNRTLKGLFFNLFLCALANAQTVGIDGWNVTYLGTQAINGNTRVTYRACPGGTEKAGVMKSFTIGVPSCFPKFVILSASPGTNLIEDRDTKNGATGIVWKGLNLTNCQDFSYTIHGALTATDLINIGLTDEDICNECCATCGEVGLLPGPKCNINGVGVCGLISHADIVLMHDQSACVTQNAANAERAASAQLVTNLSPLKEKARVAVGSYSFGKDDICNTTTWPSNMVKPDWKDYARYISLLTDDQKVADYDGYLTQNYGTINPPTNTYRALARFAYTPPYTCGKAPLDAAFKVGSLHLQSGWADPQTPNYLVIVSNGRPNRAINSTCANSCDCAEARAQAIAERDVAVSKGVKIFTIYLDDSACGCTPEQVKAGKNFLKNEIATNTANYYEATNATLKSVYERIYDKVTQFVSCEPNQFKPYEACCNEKTGTCYPCPTPSPTSTVAVKQCPPFECNEISTKSTKDGLNKKAREFFNLNKQLILRLRSKSQQAKYNKRNKDIYNQFLKSVSQVPASTTKCSANECCTDQKVNVKIKADVLALISKQYKLYLEIRKQVPKYGNPGVPCTRPKAECDRDKNKYESLLKWLDKRARQIRANELVLTKEIPLSDSECRDIYAS